MQTSKQNITRDSEIKNKLTVTRGEVGGDNGGKRGVFRNMYIVTFKPPKDLSFQLFDLIFACEIPTKI